MTKLLNTHRRAIKEYLLDATFRERELRLKQEEHAIGLRVLRLIYDDDMLRKMADLPDGWLPMTSYLHVITTEGYIWDIKLTDPVRVPANHPYRIEITYQRIVSDIVAHFGTIAAMKKERQQLEAEVHGTLAAFSTIEKLAEGWPEGYAHFPHQDLAPTGQLPALRIEDLNARIVSAQEAA